VIVGVGIDVLPRAHDGLPISPLRAVAAAQNAAATSDDRCAGHRIAARFFKFFPIETDASLLPIRDIVKVDAVAVAGHAESSH
jgi:hypothetical protein